MKPTLLYTAKKTQQPFVSNGDAGRRVSGYTPQRSRAARKTGEHQARYPRHDTAPPTQHRPTLFNPDVSKSTGNIQHSCDTTALPTTWYCTHLASRHGGYLRRMQDTRIKSQTHARTYTTIHSRCRSVNALMGSNDEASNSTHVCWISLCTNTNFIVSVNAYKDSDKI